MSMCRDSEMSFEAFYNSALEAYNVVKKFYSEGRWADVCMSSYTAALCTLRALAFKRGIGYYSSGSELMSIALTLGLDNDATLFHDIVLLSFIYYYYNYPEHYRFVEIRYGAKLAERCFNATVRLFNMLEGLLFPV